MDAADNVIAEDTPDVFNNDSDFMLITKRKNDILNDINFNSDNERFLCDNIIENMDRQIADAIKRMKVAQIPFIGCVRINPLKQEVRKIKPTLSAIRSSMTQKQYKEHVAEYVGNIKQIIKEKDNLKLRINKLKSAFKKEYEDKYKRFGSAYAELFILSKLWLKVIDHDEEWEKQYQKLIANE